MVVLEKQFRRSCCGRDPLEVDGWELGHDLPERMVPLDELRLLLLKRRADRQLSDSVWSLLVTRARQDRSRWTLGALGMMLPGLSRAASRIMNHRRLERAEVESELVLGFLEGMQAADPTMRGLAGHLLRLASQRGESTIGGLVPDGLGVRHSRLLPLHSIPGHADLVLARAVNDEVITPLEGELVARSRIEGQGLSVLAEQLRLPLAECAYRRRAAEQRIADYLRLQP
ncbi:hypothetical protein [Crossiella sp. NPDC003009]